MRKLPRLFTDQEVTLIEAGEQTGKLQVSFMTLAIEMRTQEELTGKVTSALTYPVIILVFLVLAICVVMIYVIPQIGPIIAEMAGEMPLATRTLIASSNFVRTQYISILGVLLAMYLVFRAYISTEGGAMMYDKAKLSLPLVGTVYRNYLIVRFFSTFSLLMDSGISILKTLKLTGSSSGNLAVNDMFAGVITRVSAGQKLASSIAEADPTRRIFTSDILQMLEAAEKTSTLHTITKKIAEQHRREVDTSLGIMVKFIEPVAILLAGIFVAWFALAIFSAIMQVVGGVSGG
jgi:type II secretory pathway component PulF